MSDMSDMHNDGMQEQMLEQLRNRAIEESESAPVVEGYANAPKEMRVRDLKVVIRGLIAFMVVLVILEGFVIFRVQSAPKPANFDTRVPVTVHEAPAPVVMDAPPVEGNETVMVTDNPQEFGAPLPDELQADIEAGRVAPLPDEPPPPDFAEDVPESDS